MFKNSTKLRFIIAFRSYEVKVSNFLNSHKRTSFIAYLLRIYLYVYIYILHNPHINRMIHSAIYIEHNFLISENVRRTGQNRDAFGRKMQHSIDLFLWVQKERRDARSLCSRLWLNDENLNKHLLVCGPSTAVIFSRLSMMCVPIYLYVAVTLSRLCEIREMEKEV